MIKIRKVTLMDGQIRWRAYGVSTGTDPVTGKRRQRTITAKTKGAVQAELNKIGYQVGQGTYKAPWHGTVGELIDSYLKNGEPDWEENTKLSYRLALEPAKEYFGQRKARDVVREDIEHYRDWLRAEGRRRGGEPGTGLSPRSVNLSLQQLQASYALGEADGKIAVNPVRFVKRIKREGREYVTWSEDEVRTFLAEASNERLAAAWLLSALCLRRGEVLGLMWSDVDFAAGVLHVGVRTRVLVEGAVVEKCAKSKRSLRTLPMFGPVTAALLSLHALADDTDGYVCTEDDGSPLHPDHYSDQFAAICASAGLPKIRLHDCRHSVIICTASTP